MTAALAFLRMFWKPIALIVVALAVLWYFRHYGDVRYAAGRQQAVSEQTAAAAKKAIENAQKERDDAKRITDAMRTLQDAQTELAVLRARPQPHLMCSRAPGRPDRVPESAGLPADHAAPGGLLPEKDAADSGTFDPGPDLDSLALEMAADVARCRMFVQQVLGHVPTR